MNLYRIEYTFYKDLYTQDVASGLQVKEPLAGLPTHVLADNFLKAVSLVKANHETSKYVFISGVVPTELDIRILEEQIL